MRFPILTSLLVAVALGTTFTYVSAQQQDGDQRQRGQRGQQFDPAQMRERMMDMLKERLGGESDEWEVLQPKIEAVTAAQQDLRGAGRGGFGRGQGRGQGGEQDAEQADASKLQTASRELRTVLEDDNAAPEAISKSLASYRAARGEAEAALEKAQSELKELLTARQEAMLVMMNMIE